MLLASVNADFHADKDVTVPRPYYLHLCTGESGGMGTNKQSLEWVVLWTSKPQPPNPTNPGKRADTNVKVSEQRRRPCRLLSIELL